jgi:hypothetical protein
MRWFRLSAVLLTASCICLAGALLFAAEESNSPPAEAPCRTRSVPVSAFSHDGNTALHFASSNFTASYDEKPLRVTSVAVEQQPRRIVLLLDISGSMLTTVEPAWRVPIDVARSVVDNMPANIEIGLAVFSGRIVPLVSPSANRQPLLDQIEALRASQKLVEQKTSSGTALWDSIVDAAAMLRPVQPGDVIYVVTDGADNLSRSGSSEVAQILAASGIRLFCFGIVNGEWVKLRTADQVTGATELTRVMEATGGWGMAATPAQWVTFQRSKKPPQFERDMNLQFHQLKNFYRVNLELPEPLTRPQEWRLLLTGVDQSRQKELELIYPHRLMPCN